SEHYLPKGAQGDLPQTLLGRVVGIADRLDTLVCIFGLGMSPTGSSDPFALRRAANAILNIIWDANLDLNLDQLLVATITSFVETCEKSQPLPDLQQQLRDFLAVRVHNLLQDERGIDYDLVNAVLGEAQEYQQRVLTDLLDGRDRAQFLQHIRTDGTLDTIYETVNRATRLAKQGDLPLDVLNPDDFVKPQLFEQSCEQLFYDGLLKLLPQTQAAQVTRDYQKLVQGLQAIAPAVSQFFDGDDSVLVMAEATDLRRNRLNLLGLLRNHALVLGDFGAIVKS
ncbi:MAG: glycine--tRNA ligase subunit beta, partial [Acaryochloris sp. SU_5_25]|nr:glycine--tRNA ligase subunit beta [Acaryochloris sp. SU_5_25]